MKPFKVSPRLPYVPDQRSVTINGVTQDLTRNRTWTIVSVSVLILSYVSRTSAYTITASDHTVNCTSGTFTVTLPTAVGKTGQVFAIKNSGTGVITVNTTGSQTIDDALTAVISSRYASITVQSTGANWIII